MRHARFSLGALGLSLVAVAGCAQVRPEADYNQTADQIRQRVPATQVFSPAEPENPLPDISNGLTLEQAVQMAMLANRDLQAAFADVGVARADLVQSGLLKNPTLALSGMLPEGGGRSKLAVGLGEDIADLWQIPIRKKIAQAALDGAMLRIITQAVELASTVKQTYHRAQSLRESVRIAQANIEIAQRSYDAALARFRAGQVGRIDVDLARAALLQAQLALIDVGRQVRTAQDELALAIGLDRWPAGEVDLDRLPDQTPPPVPTDAALEVALAERTDLKAQRQVVAAARNRIREEWLKVFPTLELSLDMERPERRAVPGRKIPYDTLVASAKAGKLTVPSIQPRSERQLAERQEINEVLGPGLIFPLPIFDQNQAQIAKAAIQYGQETSRYEGMVQRVEKDVRVATTNYHAASDTVCFYRSQLLPQLQTSLDTATASYQAGESSILAVIEAQKALVSSRSDANKAQLEQLLAQDDLEKAVGGPLILRRMEAAATQPAESQETASAPATMSAESHQAP